ncbi:UPF0481 protein At3g47200-like [Neltuma alba]|uniref:UPF0481 protein At3g47200-like n=1 Tax=Neltuma alba TaxID=207710 RepID=UPI0010A34DE1|nr:UPF0481 protein At3g47200-like [Prosopis alba]
MAEATHTDMNQTNLASDESAQQRAELQRLLSSQPSDLSSNHFQQPHAEDEEINIDIKALIEISEDGLLSPLCCIYRVPTTIRHLNNEAYTPKVVSIGPFHHGDKRLQEMERHKEIMLKRFAQRAMTDLDSLVNFTKQSESKVRASYFERINYDKKDLVKLILVDSAFIIQLFIMTFEGRMIPDAKLSQSWLDNAISKDLLLLENQLPLFFLDELYNIAFPHNGRGHRPSFLQLTYSYFDYLNMQMFEPHLEIKHFTDLLRSCHLPRSLTRRSMFLPEVHNDILLYSAKQLEEVGLRFRSSSSKCLLDLKYSNNVLEVPRIRVDDDTAMIFHNMIAFEQCHYPHKHYICDYALILDCLINSHEDVNILIRERIIHNYLGDPSDIVRIFDRLSTNLTLSNFNTEYSDICGRLNHFARDPGRQMKRALKRQLLLSITGFVLNMLTLIQAIFSILQVVWR